MENYKSSGNERDRPLVNVSPPTKRVTRQQKRQRVNQIGNQIEEGNTGGILIERQDTSPI